MIRWGWPVACLGALVCLGAARADDELFEPPPPTGVKPAPLPPLKPPSKGVRASLDDGPKVRPQAPGEGFDAWRNAAARTSNAQSPVLQPLEIESPPETLRPTPAPPTSAPTNSQSTALPPPPGVAPTIVLNGRMYDQPPDALVDPYLHERHAGAFPRLAAPPMLGDMLGMRGIVHQRLAGRYKIADNTSPVPMRRGWYSLNWFDNAFDQGGDALRQTAGVELTGPNRKASIDLRIGAATLIEPAGGRASFFNDVRATFKWLFFDDPGAQISTGVGVSVPAGGTPTDAVDSSFSVAPFVGYLFFDPDSRWFLHGFEQFDLPLESDSQMLLHSDIGLGFWLRRGRDDALISAAAPTVELHLYTPIGADPGGERAGLRYGHVLNFTAGVTLFFGDADSLAFGVGMPIFSTKDYDLEAHLHYVRRF